MRIAVDRRNRQTHRKARVLAGLLVFIGLVSLFGSSETRGARLHIVLAGDERCPIIGRAVAYGLDSLEYAFRTHVNPRDLTIKRVPQDRMRPTAILRIIDELPSKPGDAVVFFFAGYGDYDDDRPVFKVTNQPPLLRRDVLARLLRHETRLVVLASCCSFGPQERFDAFWDFVRPVPVPDVTSPGFQTLFFGKRGLVDITSSTRGEDSCAKIFAPAFADSLTRNHDDHRITWSRLFVEVRDSVERRAAAEQRQQTPFAFSLPDFIGIHVGPDMAVLRVWPGYPADQAGIREGDTIVSIRERRVFHPKAFSQEVAESVGNLQITIRRGGAEQTVTVRRD